MSVTPIDEAHAERLRQQEEDRRRAQVYDVLVRYDRGDGNDPLEAMVKLPIIPRIGDTIEVWVEETFSPHSEWLEVKDVVLCSYAPERIEVWVSGDGHPDDDMERIFRAADANEQP